MHKLTHTPKLMLVDNKTHKVGKRKRDDDDELPNAKRYQNDEYDSDQQVIDSYDRKPQRKSRRKFVLPNDRKQMDVDEQMDPKLQITGSHDKQIDPWLNIIDNYDEQQDPRLRVINSYDRPNGASSRGTTSILNAESDYEKLYKKCLEEQKKIKQEVKKQKLHFEKEMEEREEVSRSDIKHIQKEHRKLQQETEELHEEAIVSLKKSQN